MIPHLEPFTPLKRRTVAFQSAGKTIPLHLPCASFNIGLLHAVNIGLAPSFPFITGIIGLELVETPVDEKIYPLLLLDNFQ
jgi:hypothetical protein